MRGQYAALRFVEIIGAINAETTHARITLLNVGSEVRARVDKGIIDYSGQAGSINLFAGWEVNLRLTLPEFRGELNAQATGAVRVLLPANFQSSLEATVENPAHFVCRADLAERITQRRIDEHTVFSFGESSASIRLISRSGPIVIDN